MEGKVRLVIPTEVSKRLKVSKRALHTRALAAIATVLHQTGGLSLAEAASIAGVDVGEADAYHRSRGPEPGWQIGSVAAQRQFAARKNGLLTEIARLVELAQEISDSIRSGGPIERFLFVQWNMIGEDLNEILILCSNGTSSGGMKLLRGMFERTVILRQLAEHPEQLDDFLDYNHIRNRKNARQHVSISPEALRQDELDEIEAKYLSVKARFQETVCRKCGTQRDGMSWSKESIVSMASRMAGFKVMLLPAYYLALQETHSTEAAVLARMEISESGSLEYRDETPKAVEDIVLSSAHYLFLIAIETMVNHFGWLALKALLPDRNRRFAEIWQLR